MSGQNLNVLYQKNTATLLHPLRLRILETLRSPGSASTVARELGLPRQKINYHLRELEKDGFLEEVEKRKRGNCVERIVRATASHYLVAPYVLGELALRPENVEDHFSSTYLIALSAAAIRELSILQERAENAGKTLATFSLDVEVRFANAAARHAFAQELSETVAGLVSRYHDGQREGGRRFRFIVGGYPSLPKKDR